MSLKHIVLLISVFSLFAAHAEVYKWVDDSGKVIYSDKPKDGAMPPVKLPGMTTFKSVPAPAYTPSSSSSKGKKDADSAKGYESFKIASPANDAAFRDNAGNVKVDMIAKPALKEGHKAVISLDGKVVRVSGLSYTFTTVDRGTHVLSAHIEDADGKKLTDSSQVTFHLQRFTKKAP